MKPLVRILLFSLTAFLFASCYKTVDAPMPAADPLAGAWYISDAAEYNGSGWYHFDPGITGVLTFYTDGGAEYDDGYEYMQGQWYRYIQTGGYYDEWGNYYNNEHEAFQVQVSNNAGGSLDLYFDDISFSGYNRFVATYYNGRSVEKYIFSRYQ